jgi:F-type H+-transporting ATPase subunit alpha
MFASDLDPASRAQLAKGARLVELLKQPQASPYPVEEQVVSIWLGTTGQLDSVAVEDVRRFETEFLDHLRRNKSDLLGGIRESGKLPDETREALESEVKTFKDKSFDASNEDAVPVGSDEESGDDAMDSDQEQIVKQKR